MKILALDLATTTGFAHSNGPSGIFDLSIRTGIIVILEDSTLEFSFPGHRDCMLEHLDELIGHHVVSL